MYKLEKQDNIVISKTYVQKHNNQLSAYIFLSILFQKYAANCENFVFKLICNVMPLLGSQ